MPYWLENVLSFKTKFKNRQREATCEKEEISDFYFYFFLTNFTEKQRKIHEVWRIGEAGYPVIPKCEFYFMENNERYKNGEYSIKYVFNKMGSERIQDL